MNKIRTRYAPSPTGHLHIGGARTALFSYLFAKKHNGSFIIRTEDTDINRNISYGEESQINNLAWLGIVADESAINPNPKYGPYRQSERLDIYKKYIDQLIAKKMAYIAYDTREELLTQKEEQKERKMFSFRYDPHWLKISNEEKKLRYIAKKYVIRLRLPDNTYYSWKDLIRSKITVKSNEIGDFVIWKEDQHPTYNFACAIDDHLMEISHVFRGEEHISNTPKQIAIYKMLDWEIPVFAHFTIITNMEGKKLSKRDDTLDQFIEDYKDKGYISSAMFNFLALLGWSPAFNQEIMSHDKIIESFDMVRMSKSPSKYDIKKLEWFSNQYYKKLSITELRKRLIPYIDSNLKDKDQYWIDLLLTTYQPQLYADNQIIALTHFFFKEKTLNKEELNILNVPKSQKVIKTFWDLLKDVDFTLDNIKNVITKTKEITKENGKDVFIPIRLATTHMIHGPELFKAIFLSSKTIAKKRLIESIK